MSKVMRSRNAGGAPDLQAAHDARGRPGQHGPHRLRARRLEGHHAAVALRDVRAAPRSRPRARRGPRPLEIAGHHRSEVGVHHDRRQPLVLAELRRDLVRARHEAPGSSSSTMRRARAARGAGRRSCRGSRRRSTRAPAARSARAAARTWASSSGVSMRPSWRRRSATSCRRARGTSSRRLVGLQIVEMRAALAADLEQVAEPLGGDEARSRAAVLDQRIGGDGGAVAEVRRPSAGVASAASRRPSTTPWAMARDGSSGVLGTFQTRTSPVRRRRGRRR